MNTRTGLAPNSLSVHLMLGIPRPRFGWEISLRTKTCVVITETTSTWPGKMTEKLVDLRPNRDLLDSNFDGYKLSLDSLPTYRLALSGGN